MDKDGMAENTSPASEGNEKFKLLSAAVLLDKVNKGISNDELYFLAERKFDTLTDILNDSFKNVDAINEFGYTLDDLKEVSHLTFSRLISDEKASPYQVLCVGEDVSFDEVKRRRNKLLQIFHPDKGTTDSRNGEKARKINNAYMILEKTQRRVTEEVQFQGFNAPRPMPYREKDYEKKLFIAVIAVIGSLLCMWFLKTMFLY